MNAPTKLQVIDGARRLALTKYRLSEKDVANCLPQKDPEAVVVQLAGAMYDEANAAVLAEGRERKAQLAIDVKHERRVKAKLDGKRKRAAGTYAKTPAHPDAATRMSWPERITHWLFVLMRFVLLGVTIGLIAMYVRASSYSPDLSSSWPKALAYGFPVLLVSYSLSSIAEARDDLRGKRAIAIILTASGTLVLLFWIAATAKIFGFDTSANQAFQVTFGSGATPEAVPTDLFSVVFPQSMAGKLLLFTHVLGDVLISAACAVWSKLYGLKGRETEHVVPKAFLNLTEQTDLASLRLKSSEAQLAHISGIEAEYPLGRAACVNEARMRLTAMALELEASHLMAKVSTIHRLSAAK